MHKMEEPMLVSIAYRREHALEYARRWAFDRNPLFENYNGIGGDCTNFVSQCVYAGSCVMNYTPTFGWYYISSKDRSAAWTGVEYFYNFMTTNVGVAPYATETYPGGLIIGDVIQLARPDGKYYHSLLVTGYDESGYLVASHSDNALDRPLSTYQYATARFLHIEQVRIEIPDIYNPDCFENFYNGTEI